jgi:MiaB-like tRNA modifying enzyme
MPTIHIEVYGCSANAADAEIVQGLLLEAGYGLAERSETADASMVLTCVVKTPTEQKIVKRIRELARSGRPLIVAGCMPKVLQEVVEEIAPAASLLGPDDILSSVEVVEETLKGNKVVFVDGEAPDRTLLPRKRRSGVVHIAPIASGCLGSCSYCIVKNARGRLRSFPAEGIVEDARNAVADGCREIWLTAEDTAAYDDGGLRLPELIGRLSDLAGKFYIRVGMMTPNEAEPILEDLIGAYRSEKVFKFLHVPFQSGSDDILRRMRRRYTVDDFLRLTSRFREAFPELNISTDVICGFPGETEDQFRASVGLVEKLKPGILNISRFWPRPGTEASAMGTQLHGRETKRRSRIMSSFWRGISVETSLRWVGWRGEILVDEEGHSGSMVGRNYAYKPVAVRTDKRPGEFVDVEVTKAGAGYLLGREV